MNDYKKRGVDLSALPLEVLRNIDVESPLEERVLQSIIDKKLRVAPVQVEINRAGDKTDFRSPAEEAEFQKVIDERVASARPKPEILITEEVEPSSAVELLKEEVLETKIEELKEEKAKLDRFCEFCTSKGVRHLKTCNRPQ